jgi:hypothetical protein
MLRDEPSAAWEDEFVRLRRYRIEKHIQRRDLSITDDDHIQACVVGRLAAWPRPPGQTPGIVEGLGLAMRGVDEVRVGRAEIARKLIKGGVS